MIRLNPALPWGTGTVVAVGCVVVPIAPMGYGSTIADRRVLMGHYWGCRASLAHFVARKTGQVLVFWVTIKGDQIGWVVQ